MILTIDRRLMDALYGPRLKLFVASADAAQFVRDPVSRALAACGIELIQYEAGDDEDSAARLHSPGVDGGDFASLAIPPTGPCLLAVATPQGREQLASLRAWWQENGPTGSPEVLELDGCSTDQTAWPVRLLQRLVEIAQADARRSAEREVGLCAQLCELRQEYDQARGAMQTMQDHLARMSLAPCSLSYTFPSSSEVFHPGSEGETVRQPLPVRAEGLAGIDLYLARSANRPNPHEHFIVTLKAREASEPLGTWMIAGARLNGGWTRCAFPVALASPFHQLELVVQWSGMPDHCPGLALSPVQPWREYCASVNDKPLTGALAHAVWNALPGAKTGFESTPFRDSHDPDAMTTFTYVVGRDDITRAVATTDTAVHYLDPMPALGGFRLHPLDGMVASAVLPEVCFSGTQSITAVAQIAHPAAKYPVEYAIALTRSSAKHREFPQDARAKDVVAISKWQSVPADGSPHVVGLTLAQACVEPLDLHVATRMSKDHPTAHQWADWLDVRVTLRCLMPVMPMRE